MGSSRRRKGVQGSAQVADWKFTYQDRVSEFRGVAADVGGAALSAYAELHGRIERTLFGQSCAGSSLASLKSSYLIKYKISARMFNSLRVALEGKVSAVRESMKLRVESLERRIARAEVQIARALKQGRLNAAHQKRRRLSNLVHRLKSLRSDISDGVSNCSRISGFQYVMVIKGQADRGCAQSLVCVADWSSTNTSSGMMGSWYVATQATQRPRV